MEEIKYLISKGQINTNFVDVLKEFVSGHNDVKKLPRILSYLYSESSIKTKIKSKEREVIQCVEESVVLLLKSSLALDVVQSDPQLRAYCLRYASNFSVIFHQEGIESNIILDTTIECVVQLIQTEITWTPEELNQTLGNLRSLLSLKLSKNTLSSDGKHSIWNQLVWMYKPLEDKTHLISLLNSKINISCNIHYLESSAEIFTKDNFKDLVGILDNYYAYYWKKDIALIYKAVNSVLNQITSGNNNNNNNALSVYKYLHEITHHIVSKAKAESALQEYFALFNFHLNNLVNEYKKDHPQPGMHGQILCSILNHFSFFQIKHMPQLKNPHTVQVVLESYETIFKLAQAVRAECGNSRKQEPQLLNQCWYVCVSIVIGSLSTISLHEKLIHALTFANQFISCLFMDLYRQGDTQYDLKCFVLNLGKLTQDVHHLDAKNINRKINPILVKPLLDIFLAIPDQFATPLADYIVSVLYNCIKSSSQSILDRLEPLVTLACRNLAFIPAAVRSWVRVQLQHKMDHTEYEWTHLCDHIDSILPQLRAKHPGVSFLDTCGRTFVSRVLKCELDEVFAYRQFDKNCSISYETTLARRALSLIQSSSPQDLTLCDICLACLNLTFKHDALSQYNTKLKAYVYELKKTLKTIRNVSCDVGNTRKPSDVKSDSNDLVSAEQKLVTQNALVCLLFAQYYVIEHFDNVAKKRASVKKSQLRDSIEKTDRQRVNDLDKGIEVVADETNVFPTSMDVRETEEVVKLLDTVALILSKMVQTEVSLDLEKISSVTKMERVVSSILYVGYSYRLYLEPDKETEYWKLALQLSVLLNQDALFVECVCNLSWLDETLLRPSHLARADELVAATLKPPLPSDVKTLYKFAKVKHALSLNELSKASEDLAQIELNRLRTPTIQEILLLYYFYYLKCQIIMKKPNLNFEEHAYIAACCDEAFRCLFKNYDTLNHTTPLVVHVMSCYLNITLLTTRFHTTHLNPQEARRILSAVLKFSQEMCLPLWTAQLLSLSAGLDMITCNKEDLLFKTTCLEQVLLHEDTTASEKSVHSEKNSDTISSHSNQKSVLSEKVSSYASQKSLLSEINSVHDENLSHITPSYRGRRTDEAMRDAVVTKSTITSSSLASPRFVSTVSNKLPAFIAHRSCQCFECRNSVYHELLVSLGLLQGLYYQLNKEYELTTFFFLNAEHLLNKLKILKGFPEDLAVAWQVRLLFYRANLEGILQRPRNVIKLNQELQLLRGGGEEYFDRYSENGWHQEQYLMFVGATLDASAKASTSITPRKPKTTRIKTIPPELFRTPKVQNVNVKSIFGVDTAFPVCKYLKDAVTPKAKVRLTLHFEEDDGKVESGNDAKACEEKDKVSGEGNNTEEKLNKAPEDTVTPEKNNGVKKISAKQMKAARTTARKPRRVKTDHPVIVEEDMEIDLETIVPQVEKGWSPKTAKKEPPCKTYTSVRKRRGLPSTQIQLTSFTPVTGNEPATLATETPCEGQVSPRSSLSAVKKKSNRGKVLFESDDDDNTSIASSYHSCPSSPEAPPTYSTRRKPSTKHDPNPSVESSSKSTFSSKQMAPRAVFSSSSSIESLPMYSARSTARVRCKKVLESDSSDSSVNSKLKQTAKSQQSTKSQQTKSTKSEDISSVSTNQHQQTTESQRNTKSQRIIKTEDVSCTKSQHITKAKDVESTRTTESQQTTKSQQATRRGKILNLNSSTSSSSSTSVKSTSSGESIYAKSTASSVDSLPLHSARATGRRGRKVLDSDTSFSSLASSVSRPRKDQASEKVLDLESSFSSMSLTDSNPVKHQPSVKGGEVIDFDSSISSVNSPLSYISKYQSLGKSGGGKVLGLDSSISSITSEANVKAKKFVRGTDKTDIPSAPARVKLGEKIDVSADTARVKHQSTRTASRRVLSSDTSSSSSRSISSSIATGVLRGKKVLPLESNPSSVSPHAQTSGVPKGISKGRTVLESKSNSSHAQTSGVGSLRGRRILDSDSSTSSTASRSRIKLKTVVSNITKTALSSQEEDQENKPPNALTSRSRKVPPKAAEEFLTPAQPKGEKAPTKRKPRSQLPKSPFIF